MWRIHCSFASGRVSAFLAYFTIPSRAVRRDVRHAKYSGDIIISSISHSQLFASLIFTTRRSRLIEISFVPLGAFTEPLKSGERLTVLLVFEGASVIGGFASFSRFMSAIFLYIVGSERCRYGTIVFYSKWLCGEVILRFLGCTLRSCRRYWFYRGTFS